MASNNRWAEHEFTPTVMLDLQLADLLAFHVGSIMRDIGKFGLSAREGIYADVTITNANPEIGGWDVWDQVTINGHSCGNRCGGAKAYLRLVAGDPDWHRP